MIMKTTKISIYFTNMEGKVILTANQSHHGMGHRLEEKEAVEHVDFGQQNCTSSYKIHKSDNVENANNVQDHVPWTGQGFTQASHHD